MASKAKAVVGLVGIVLSIILIVYWSGRISETGKEADAATAEYIAAVEEVYGQDRDQWPQCIKDSIEYSQTNPLIRIIQHGGTEMPDFCGTRGE